MLKQFLKSKAIFILCVLLLFTFFESLPAEALFITTEQEVELGQESAYEIEAEYGVCDNDYRAPWVREVGNKLADILPRDGITYKFKILNMDVPNAFAVPGGWIYVTKNMLDDFVCDDEDLLAFILGHELGHVNRRHSMDQLEIRLGVTQLLEFLTQGDTAAMNISMIVPELMLLSYSREQEIEADTYGMTVAYQGGYDPRAATNFFVQLKEYEDSDPTYLPEFLSSHPDTATRILWSQGYVTILTGEL